MRGTFLFRISFRKILSSAISRRLFKLQHIVCVLNLKLVNCLRHYFILRSRQFRSLLVLWYCMSNIHYCPITIWNFQSRFNFHPVIATPIYCHHRHSQIAIKFFSYLNWDLFEILAVLNCCFSIRSIESKKLISVKKDENYFSDRTLCHISQLPSVSLKDYHMAETLRNRTSFWWHVTFNCDHFDTKRASYDRLILTDKWTYFKFWFWFSLCISGHFKWF